MCREGIERTWKMEKEKKLSIPPESYIVFGDTNYINVHITAIRDSWIVCGS